MKYILLIITVFSLAACNDNNGSSSNPIAPEQPETVPEEQPETALETAGLLPESKTFTLSIPNTQELPKELFVPQLN